LSIAVIFGQSGLADVPDLDDLGFAALKTIKRSLERQDFEVTEVYPRDEGYVLGGQVGRLRARVELWSPARFPNWASAPDDRAVETFRRILKSNEIFVYHGHSFYGALDVFDEPSAYPEDTYQIIFVNSCWSYGYYASDILRHRSDDDHALVDVLHNVEAMYSDAEYSIDILLSDVFEATKAVAAGTPRGAAQFSWQAITEELDEAALHRRRVRDRLGGENWEPEVYGVAGALHNRFRP
jgi:hypothetical protein